MYRRRAERPITVVRIIDRLNVGGPALHVALASAGLDGGSFRTVLVHGSLEPGEADMADEVPASVERVVIPSLGRELRPLRDLSTLVRLVRLMRRVRPDVVHTHKAKAGALGRLAALLAGVPVRVHTFHGHVLRGYFGRWKSALFVGIERLLGRASTRIIALSPSLADELAHDLGVAARQRFVVVPLGLDVRPFHLGAGRHRGRLRAELGVGEDVKLVGIVGRMVPVKDHLLFVAAACRLAAQRPDVHFVFIGGGELEPQVRAALDGAGLTPRAHLLGWRRDLPVLYPDLDCLALSSKNEGTPVAMIEAMAAGVPVASTAVGGVPELLGHGARGELATPGDASSLASAIDRALGAEAVRRAARQRHLIVEQYGASRLVSDLADLYAALLAERKGPVGATRRRRPVEAIVPVDGSSRGEARVSPPRASP